MENKNKTEQIKYPVEKRGFYNYKDAGNTFLASIFSPYIVAILLVALVKIICNASGGDASAVVNSVWFNIISSIITPLLFLSVYLVYNKVARVKFSATRINVKLSAWTWVIVAIVPFICVFGLRYLIGAVDMGLSALGYDLASTGLPLNTVGWYFVNILLLAVLPAIAEELVFRGVIFNGLRRNMGDFSAMCLSSFLFMLMHGNLEQVIYPFILGLILAWIVLRTGSVAASIVVHFLNNAIVITLGFVESITGWSVSVGANWLYFLLAGVFLIVGAGVIYLIEKFFFKGKNNNDVEKAEKTNGFSLSMYIGVGLGVLLLIISTISNFL